MLEQIEKVQARVFIAIPLFCSADTKIVEYFSNEKYLKELSAITGADLIVAIPKRMRAQDDFIVYDKVREGRRFRIDVADIPCIYFEDDKSGWVAILIDDDLEKLRLIFKSLATVARKARLEDTAASIASKLHPGSYKRLVAPLKTLASSEGDFQRILNPYGAPADPAIRRHELAMREARIARLDADNKPVGTSWLVGPDLLLTAYHNISSFENRRYILTALFDHKFIPKSNSQFLVPGRRVKFAKDLFLAISEPLSKVVELSADGATPEKLDFALLRLAERVGSDVLDGAQSDQTRGWFQLPRDECKFDLDQGLVIMGHPQTASTGSVFPLKLTNAAPSQAQLTKHGCRVRYAVNTDVGSSGSPVMDENFCPLALHHLGSQGKPDWDAEGRWPKGFNQGIPLHLIVESIKAQVDESICRELQI